MFCTESLLANCKWNSNKGKRGTKMEFFHDHRLSFGCICIYIISWFDPSSRTGMIRMSSSWNRLSTGARPVRELFLIKIWINSWFQLKNLKFKKMRENKKITKRRDFLFQEPCRKPRWNRATSRDETSVISWGRLVDQQEADFSFLGNFCLPRNR